MMWLLIPTSSGSGGHLSGGQTTAGAPGAARGCGSARRTGSLIRFSGLVAVTELVDRLGVIDRLDAAIGPIKTRARGHRQTRGYASDVCTLYSLT